MRQESIGTAEKFQMFDLLRCWCEMGTNKSSHIIQRSGSDISCTQTKHIPSERQSELQKFSGVFGINVMMLVGCVTRQSETTFCKLCKFLKPITDVNRYS